MTARATADGRVEVQVAGTSGVLAIGEAARLLADLAAALGEAVRVATAGLAADPVILLDRIREAAADAGRAVPSSHRDRQTQVALSTALLCAVGADLGEPAHWAQLPVEPLTGAQEAPARPLTTHRVDERNLPRVGGQRSLQPPLLVALDAPPAAARAVRRPRLTACDHCHSSDRDAGGALIHAFDGCPGALPKVEAAARRPRRVG